MTDETLKTKTCPWTSIAFTDKNNYDSNGNRKPGFYEQCASCSGLEQSCGRYKQLIEMKII